MALTAHADASVINTVQHLIVKQSLTVLMMPDVPSNLVYSVQQEEIVNTILSDICVQELVNSANKNINKSHTQTMKAAVK